ncbi:ectoine dioxygenase-like [Branchiostoma floridae]|uniref:Ectoine dioxygenase-like n=1 Tax=Branchiostoma floridae TaxID=7739 RepID=A0A9J7LJI1_BRAFL|nr:ectoine dioxygenase-like [Branchiostoma floridae]
MAVAEYSWSEHFDVTSEVKSDFEKHGYIIVRGLLSKEEMLKVRKAAEHLNGLRDFTFEIPDGRGRNSSYCIWSQPGNDVTGMVGRIEKVVGTMEKLLEGEVYHYHGKLVMKEPHTGGNVNWHQDYGYWYKNGCLFPHMGSVLIAVDKADRENGCLQVLRGSHKLGRIDHTFVGGQTGADKERLNQVMKIFTRDYVELEEGDALFFHCNLLHSSDKNDSPRRRWNFICSYNRASNNPVYVHHHPQYTPLHKVPNDAILTCENFTDLSGKDFMDPAVDKTIKIDLEDSEKD